MASAMKGVISLCQRNLAKVHHRRLRTGRQIVLRVSASAPLPIETSLGPSLEDGPNHHDGTKA